MVAAQLATAFNPFAALELAARAALPAGLRAALPAAVPPLLLVRERSASSSPAGWRRASQGRVAPRRQVGRRRTSTRDDGAEVPTPAARPRSISSPPTPSRWAASLMPPQRASTGRSLRLLFGCAGCSFATLGARLLMLRIGRRPLLPPRACPELACLAASSASARAGRRARRRCPRCHRRRHCRTCFEPRPRHGTRLEHQPWRVEGEVKA